MMTFMKNWNIWLKFVKYTRCTRLLLFFFIVYSRQHRQIFRKPTADPEPFRVSKNT